MISSVSPGFGASLTGLQSASKRIETAAQNIAAAPQKTYQPDSAQADDYGFVAVPKDPTQDLINLDVASYDFKANAKVIEMQDKAQQTLLDIKT